METESSHDHHNDLRASPADRANESQRKNVAEFCIGFSVGQKMGQTCDASQLQLQLLLYRFASRRSRRTGCPKGDEGPDREALQVDGGRERGSDGQVKVSFVSVSQLSSPPVGGLASSQCGFGENGKPEENRERSSPKRGSASFLVCGMPYLEEHSSFQLSFRSVAAPPTLPSDIGLSSAVARAELRGCINARHVGPRLPRPWRPGHDLPTNCSGRAAEPKSALRTGT